MSEKEEVLRKVFLTAFVLLVALLADPMAWLEGSPQMTSYAQDCPKLESHLYRIAQSSEPERTANQSNLYYSKGRIRVIIELTEPAVSPPEVYSLIIESRYAALIQALVAIQDLCTLSQEPSVKFVRAPYPATPSAN